MATGVLAFFDILGYQSFLKNNSGESTLGEAEKVLKFITELPPTVNKEMGAQWTLHEVHRGQIGKEVMEKFKFLIFSDTIVASIEYPQDASKVWKLTALGYLALYSSKLFSYMFHKGLPTRATITEGDFISVEHCLAGKAIVEAYELCQSLDFSGIVFHQSVEKYLPELIDPSASSKFLVRYYSPVHREGETHLTHLNWIGLFNRVNQSEIILDIETYVYQAFWMHKKDCGLSVEPKVRNTVKLIRYLLMVMKGPPQLLLESNSKK